MLDIITNTVEPSEIQLRIKALNDMSEADLQHEMRDLKEVLLANPAACTMLLDEDIGMLVAARRKLTAKAMEEAEKPKTRTRTTSTATKPKKLTAEELAAALEDDDF